MNCPRCGTDVGESKFCPECGAKIDSINTDESSTSSAEVSAESSAYYEALKKVEEERKAEEKANKKKKNKRKGIGCLSVILLAIIIFVVPTFFSSYLSAFAVKRAIKNGENYSSVYSENMKEYKGNTLAARAYSLGKYSFKKGLPEFGAALFCDAIKNEEDSTKYKDSITKFVNNQIDKYVKDEDFTTIIAISPVFDMCDITLDDDMLSTLIDKSLEKNGYAETIKLLEKAENNIEISDSLKAKTAYTSIEATYVGDKQSGDSVYDEDFEVKAVYPDGSSITLSEYDYSVSADKYTPGKTMEITIYEDKYDLKTTIKVKCPKQHYFTEYSRKELSEEMYSFLNSVSRNRYSIEYKKDNKGIIIQASFKLAGTNRYLFFLRFEENGIESYSKVTIDANVVNNTIVGTTNTYYNLRSDMENLKSHLVGLTGGNVVKYNNGELEFEKVEYEDRETNVTSTDLNVYYDLTAICKQESVSAA